MGNSNENNNSPSKQRNKNSKSCIKNKTTKSSFKISDITDILLSKLIKLIFNYLFGYKITFILLLYAFIMGIEDWEAQSTRF